jgi:adenylate kinase
MPKVVYLTGAPAAGKSSTTRLLTERVPGLLVWEYGARLTEHITARSSGVAHQDDLRTRSAGVVTPEDVTEVDRALVAFVTEHRNSRPIVIDSHATNSLALHRTRSGSCSPHRRRRGRALPPMQPAGQW